LDTTFDTDGKVSTNISSNTTGSSYKRDSALTVALQTDGKILVGGLADDNSGKFESVLVRYNSNGSLDASFGQGGILRIHLPNGLQSELWTIAVQPTDGRIVGLVATYDNGQTGGTVGWTTQVARFNTDGSPDTSFGLNGTGMADMEPDVAWGMALQEDGSIVVLGNTGNPQTNTALGRITSTGVVDTTFGNGGLSVVAGLSGPRSVAIRPSDGKIVVGGYAAGQGFVARFLPNGSIDTSFGDDGVSINLFTNSSSGFGDVTLQADGKIVAVGSATTQINKNTTQTKSLVARFLNDAFGRPSHSAGGPVTAFDHWASADLNPNRLNLMLNAANTYGSFDVFAMKVNSDGNFQWAETFGGSGDDLGWGIAVSSSGVVHLTGSFSGSVDFNPDPLVTYELNAPVRSFFLLKLRQ
jgi:uncharacterized delta-60 repeat protein